jgi:CMP-N,N'-diacetyllegionaminic acid synthase
MSATLILIPARAGSQRLKNKNKKILNNKPLISHTIEFAIKTKITANILLSTNDEDIIKIGKKYKILVPWKRPECISKSKTKSIEFALHAIKWFEKKYYKLQTVILMQPTSPFRSIKTFKSMMKIYDIKKQSVATVTNKIKNGKNLFYLDKRLKTMTKNKTNKNILAAQIVGNLYFNSVNNLKSYKNFVNIRTIPFLIKSKKELIDIDTKADWKDAEKIINE